MALPKEAQGKRDTVARNGAGPLRCCLSPEGGAFAPAAPAPPAVAAAADVLAAVLADALFANPALPRGPRGTREAKAPPGPALLGKQALGAGIGHGALEDGIRLGAVEGGIRHGAPLRPMADECQEDQGTAAETPGCQLSSVASNTGLKGLSRVLTQQPRKRRATRRRHVEAAQGDGGSFPPQEGGLCVADHRGPFHGCAGSAILREPVDAGVPFVHQGSWWDPLEPQSEQTIVQSLRARHTHGAQRPAIWDDPPLAATCSWRFDDLVQSGCCSDTDVLLLERVMQTAAALEESDLPTFRNHFRWLSQVSNPTGKPVQRAMHYALHGMMLRCTGTGYTAFNMPPQKPPQVMGTAWQWFVRHQPIAAQTPRTFSRAAFLILEGSPRIHIIEFGQLMAHQWPAIFHALSRKHNQQQQQRHAPAGAAMAVPRQDSVLKVRLTLIRMAGLICPARAAANPQHRQELQLSLKGAAEKAGVHLELQMLDLARDNLPGLVAQVERRPADTLLVVAGLVFDNLPDGSVLDFGIRETTLEWIASLKPLVFAMVSVELDANALPLLGRLSSILRHDLAMFLTHNAVVGAAGGGWEHAFAIEEAEMGRDAVNVISCEDHERVFRPMALERWRHLMALAGLVPGPLLGLEDAHSALNRFPRGLSLHTQHGSLTSCWQGIPVSTLSFWVPTR